MYQNKQCNNNLWTGNITELKQENGADKWIETYDVNEIQQLFDSENLTTLNISELLNSQNLETFPYLNENGPQIISTMDNEQQLRDHPMNKLPDLEKVDCGYNFDVFLNGDSNNWIYSPDLDKIFIKISSVMNVHLSYRPLNENLYVRAMILYSNPDDMHLPVKRCPNHSTNDQTSHADHILKCCDPHAEYRGNGDGAVFKDRLSITVPLTQMNRDDNGNASMSIGYEFGCQNSCSRGINRRTTSIMFTLENEQMQILGKRAIQVKVCSCPKRDCDRELSEKPSKRKASAGGSYPKGKKPKYTEVKTEVKTEPEDSDAPSSPIDCIATANVINQWSTQLNMPTREMLLYVLDCAYDKIAGEMARDRKSNNHNDMIKFLKNLQKQIADIKRQ